ncbi:complement regulator-acquiring protein [Borreliella kurtenbachii]|uniref:complement regulator-acquiring protein n=1 Tax=Borreliella kurtenbachii TaxID=1196056 RepID=UPI002659109F|nr:complement regulator-acquiring protein [Borreliella kurtenbachii]WKC86782.1 complement regulator-acquiring protein [Borreliella kurtenbachii]
MKKNIIWKTLKLFQITLLVSCSFYSKSNNTEATSELQSNLIKVKSFGVEKAENLKNIQHLQQSQLLKDEKEAIIKKIAQKFNENEKLIKKISLNIEIFTQKIKTDIQKIEPADQFGINTAAFPEKQDMNIDFMLKDNRVRRLFYSSLNYDENKIKKLATILAQTSSSTGYHYTLIGSIFWTGFKIQEALENAVKLLTKDEQRRLMFNFRTKTVKEIQEKFEKLIQERNSWITTIDNIIGEYDNNAGGARTDGKILGETIRLGYEHKFNPNESMQILNDIETPLKTCCDHIHY